MVESALKGISVLLFSKEVFIIINDSFPLDVPALLTKNSEEIWLRSLHTAGSAQSSFVKLLLSLLSLLYFSSDHSIEHPFNLFRIY